MPIVLENVSFTYMSGTPFEKKALDEVNLRIDDGEFVGIIGQTGSGKSTLVQLINGLLLPTSGSATINGILTTGHKVKLKPLRQQVGLVFQFPEHQLFADTVAEDIAFGPRNLGIDEAEAQERVARALRLVGLPEDLKERSPFELSGGQMRRVAIAGVLAMEPNILILDEPTAGLDPQGREDILSQIRQLQRQRDNTVILVSHSMEDVARLVNRLIVLHRGKIVYDGTAREVFRHREHLKTIGLGVPQVTEVLQGLRSKGWDVPEVALTVAEAREAIMAAWQRRNTNECT
ncbi:MAG: energy-coupling factor transporter ATPase [bacterium]|nr:energy-coupling factor transporter ATPase [bacterium]